MSGQKLEFVIDNNVTIKKLNLKYENVKELDYNFGENAEFEEVFTRFWRKKRRVLLH